MSLELEATAPDFTAETTHGPIRFHEWAGEQWVVFFSHPKDYSAVCMTELGEVARLKPELEKRNAKALGLSLNPVADHLAWAKDFGELQACELNFPIVGDPERKVANLYHMIHPASDNAATMRALFIVDPKKAIRAYMFYPRTTGRNFAEVLRVIDSMQMLAKHKLATPAGWRPGEDTLIPASVSDEMAKQKYPQGWAAPKPYYRVVGDPNAKQA